MFFFFYYKIYIDSLKENEMLTEREGGVIRGLE